MCDEVEIELNDFWRNKKGLPKEAPLKNFKLLCLFSDHGMH